MGANQPHFVGISGGSCSGKTWLARRLQENLGKEAALLSLDDFYLDRSHLSRGRRARLNFDHPRAIDWDRFESVLGRFAQGLEAAVPRYNFETHSRETEEPLLAPKPVLLVEGLWLFRRPSVRRLFQQKIFLRLPGRVCEGRRVERDIRERGRTEQQVKEQWMRHARPMYERFVASQARWADLVLETPPDDRWVAKLAMEIRKTVFGRAECL